MSDKKIQSILKDVMESEIPSAQIDLWLAVRADLAAGQSLKNPQGDRMNRKKYIPRLALALSLALLLVFFATPRGRTFAEGLLALFTPAESTAFPLEDSQVPPMEPDEVSPTMEPPSPILSIADAEAQAGFSIAVFPEVPAGFEFLGVRLYGNNASLEYQAQGGGGHLALMQSREGYYQADGGSVPWDSVPAEAVVLVKIGDLDGEFARGMFVVYPEQTEATWNPDAPVMRLRWADGGVWYELTKHGDVQPIEYLDMEAMIELAEGLVIQP